MKRYRIINPDFDTRARILAMPIEDHWTEEVKESWRTMKAQIRRGLALEFGPARLRQSEHNLLDLGAKPFSVVAFHNKFLEQARIAFVTGAYYPALTGACALGERILNHMILRLRDHYRATPEYKSVYRKDSFDNWDTVIGVLERWDVLLPEATSAFRELRDIRNRSIHFDPATDSNDRVLALDALSTLSSVIEQQFGALGGQPWFISGMKGESYLTKASEDVPFIREVYFPAAELVGPRHTLEADDRGFRVCDDHAYEDREVTDDEFRDLRMAQKSG